MIYFEVLKSLKLISRKNLGSTQCRKTRNSLPYANFFPSNQLRGKFFSENVDFTEFYDKMVGVKFQNFHNV